jgi:hypothetical protein
MLLGGEAASGSGAEISVLASRYAAGS